ncbi:hypothetical protein DFH07DRAFT_976929 [Mycena maculata]|uniref:Uncharacterized protein n=1 Tax=Mycena maculata TaxID=230809 RepID=A0AAD7NWE4_9AGAR|nr:hypothetical protein DFH07DRAFT_976929 [Mycena maculata]
MTPRQIFNILVGCPRLVECEISFGETLPWPSMAGTRNRAESPVNLQNLQRPHVTHYDSNLQPFPWYYITTPNLLDLTVATDPTIVYDGNPEWPEQEFMEFRNRSGFSLLSLALCFAFEEQVDEIIEVLEMMPRLRALDLRRTPMCEEGPTTGISRLLEFLTRHRNRPLSLPDLGHIVIHATTESVQMLQSRCLGDDVTLSEVVLLVNGPGRLPSNDAIEILKRNTRGGIRTIDWELADLDSEESDVASDGSDGGGDEEESGNVFEGEESRRIWRFDIPHLF